MEMAQSVDRGVFCPAQTEICSFARFAMRAPPSAAAYGGRPREVSRAGEVFGLVDRMVY
jgi:hypothetical protein